MNRTLKAFISEPYRILFPLALLCGMEGVGHWFGFAMGWMDHYSGFVHATIQMQAYMMCFIAGFLMTAMPRMSATVPAHWLETFGFVAIIVGIITTLSLTLWQTTQILVVASLVFLLVFSVRRVLMCNSSHGKIKPPIEFVWVPIALLHGILGSALLMCGNAKFLPGWSLLAGKSMVQQGFVLAIVLGVGGFMAPRLMGTFRAIQPAPTSPCCQIKTEKNRRNEMLMHVLIGLALLSSFIMEGIGWLKLAYGIRVLIVSFVVIWTKALVWKPVMQEPYVRLVWLSFWMLFIGYWSVFLFPDYRVALLHFVYLGGYSLMTFGVATMVIVSHSGKPKELSRYSITMVVIGGMVLLAMVFRILSVFTAEHYFLMIKLSSLAWLIGALLWAVRIIPLVCVVPSQDEMIRNHEDAKRRVMKMREKERNE